MHSYKFYVSFGKSTDEWIRKSGFDVPWGPYSFAIDWARALRPNFPTANKANLELESRSRSVREISLFGHWHRSCSFSKHLPSSQTRSSSSEYNRTTTLLGHIIQDLVTRVESAQTADAPMLLKFFAWNIPKASYFEWTSIIDENLHWNHWVSRRRSWIWKVKNISKKVPRSRPKPWSDRMPS